MLRVDSDTKALRLLTEQVVISTKPLAAKVDCVAGHGTGHRAPAHSVPSLKHQDLLACFFQVECGPEARHARSDDDDVPRLFDATHADPLTVIIWLGWGC